MNVLSAQQLSFSYGSRTVLRDAELTLHAGSLMGLLGANGAGKTTFFDLVCGLRQPSSGRLQRACATPLYLSQTLSTSPSLQLGELFSLVAHLNHQRPMSRTQVLARVGRWSAPLAERVEQLWRRRPSQCSYGQLRYFFALTLLCQPSALVLLDEPSAGVDPEHRHYLWQCIKAARDEGAAILVASHYVEEITRHTDGFWLLQHGAFSRFDDARAFLARYPAEDLDSAFIQAVQG